MTISSDELQRLRLAVAAKPGGISVHHSTLGELLSVFDQHNALQLALAVASEKELAGEGYARSPEKQEDWSKVKTTIKREVIFGPTKLDEGEVYIALYSRII